MNSQPSKVVSSGSRSGNQFYNESIETVDPFAIFTGVWHHKWTTLLSTLLFVVLAILILSFITPRYSATAKVLLDPRDTQVVTSQEVVSGLDLSDPVIESEVALIRSSVLLESVVREIGLERLAEFDPRQASQNSWRDRLNRGFENVMSFFGGGASQPLEPSDGAEAGANNLHRQAVGMLRKYLIVNQQGNSYAISISATAKEPEVVALLVNAIAERYIASQLEERIEGTRRAGEWLQERVDELRTQVSNAEVALEESRAAKLVADGGSFDATSRQLAAMSAELARARADRAEAQARHDQINELLEAEGFGAVSEVLSSSFVISLRGTLSQLTREQAGLSENLGADHPDRVRLNAMISQIEDDLSQEVQKIIDGLKNEVEVAGIRERSIGLDLLTLEERASSMALSSVELRHLEREAQALRRQYDNMQARLKETRAHEALAGEEAKVIEYALPPAQPSYPQNKLLISAAAVLGAALGLGLSLLMELSSATYRTSAQILRELRLPVLAALPKQTEPGAWRFNWQKSSPVDFDERIMRLYFSTAARESEAPGVIAVTSSVEGEGVYSTSLALARLGAAVGNKRVVFVDLTDEYESDDGASPTEPQKSLAALVRKNGSLETVIQSDESFDVLRVGEFKDGTAGSSSVSNFAQLIKKLQQEYDLVIFCVPPVLNSSQVPFILSEADALVYAVRWNKTRSTTVQHALASLLDFGIVPSGVVLTDVDEARIHQVHQGHRSMRLSGGLS